MWCGGINVSNEEFFITDTLAIDLFNHVKGELHGLIILAANAYLKCSLDGCIERHVFFALEHDLFSNSKSVRKGNLSFSSALRPQNLPLLHLVAVAFTGQTVSVSS
jgi:hypothetical protein